MADPPAGPIRQMGSTFNPAHSGPENPVKNSRKNVVKLAAPFGKVVVYECFQAAPVEISGQTPHVVL